MWHYDDSLDEKFTLEELEKFCRKKRTTTYDMGDVVWVLDSNARYMEGD